MSDEARIQELVDRHFAEKKDRRFLMADQIRDELRGQGVIVTDNGWECARWRALATQSVVGEFRFDPKPTPPSLRALLCAPTKASA